MCQNVCQTCANGTYYIIPPKFVTLPELFGQRRQAIVSSLDMTHARQVAANAARFTNEQIQLFGERKAELDDVIGACFEIARRYREEM